MQKVTVIICTTLSQVNSIISTENYKKWTYEILERVEKYINTEGNVGISIIHDGEFSSVNYYKSNPHLYEVIEFKNSNYSINKRRLTQYNSTGNSSFNLTS